LHFISLVSDSKYVKSLKLNYGEYMVIQDNRHRLTNGLTKEKRV